METTSRSAHPALHSLAKEVEESCAKAKSSFQTCMIQDFKRKHSLFDDCEWLGWQIKRRMKVVFPLRNGLLVAEDGSWPRKLVTVGILYFVHCIETLHVMCKKILKVVYTIE